MKSCSISSKLWSRARFCSNQNISQDIPDTTPSRSKVGAEWYVWPVSRLGAHFSNSSDVLPGAVTVDKAVLL